MKKSFRFIFLICIKFILCCYSFGQQNIGDAGQAGEFLRYGVGGRALSMGGAYGAIAYDASAPLWNPAGLSHLDKVHILLMCNNLRFSSKFNYFSVAKPFRLSSTFNFAIAGSWASFNSSDYEERDELSTFQGNFAETQNAFIGSIAGEIAVTPIRINFGCNLDRISNSVNLASKNYFSSDYGFDWGFIFNLMELKFWPFRILPSWINGYIITPIQFGYTENNAHKPEINIKRDEYHDIFPTSRRLSFGYIREKVAESSMDFTLALDRIELLNTTRLPYWNLGCEIKHTFSSEDLNINLRFGARNISEFDVFTTGLGIGLKLNKLFGFISKKWELGLDFYYRFDENEFLNQTEWGFSSLLSYKLKSPQQMEIKEVKEPPSPADTTMPPDITLLEIMKIEFKDRDKNGFLNGDETGTISISIRNKSSKNLQNVEVFFVIRDSLKYRKYLRFEKKIIVTEIISNSERVIDYPIAAEKTIPKDTIDYIIKIKYNNEIISQEDQLLTDILLDSIENITTFPTPEFSTTNDILPVPNLIISNIIFDDVNGNEDHCINLAELINVNFTLINKGNCLAESVKVVLKSSDSSIYIKEPNKFLIGSIKPGDSTFVKFSFYVSENYSGPEILPIEIEILEKRKEFGLASQNLKLKISRSKSSGNFFSDKLTDVTRNFILNSNDFFVLIGINKYENRQIGDLKYAVSDAESLKSFLEKKTRYKLFDKLYDKDATKQKVMNIVNELSKKVTEKGRIIFFFSGHGATRKGIHNKDLGYLLVHDSDINNLVSTGISMDEIYTWAKTLRARNVLFIFDACFSGIIGTSMKTEINYNLDFLARNIGRQVIAAGRKDDIIKEYDKLEHGALSYYLLKGLKGEADSYPKDNVITLGELKTYLENEVTNFTENKQRPRIVYLDLGDGELFFELLKY